MVSFLGGLVLLIAGYFLYGSFVERVFHPDSRQTPAYAMEDNVDFVPMSTSRAFLVQLLNIAGLGPIFGALSGALWGPVVYIWIVLGTIFARRPRLPLRHAFRAQQRRVHLGDRG